MKNVLIKASIIGSFCIIILLGYFSHQNYKEKKQLVYNENVLMKTLEKQVEYLEKNNDCNKDVLSTSQSILKHLKITKTKLKNKIGLKKNQTLLEKRFLKIESNCLRNN